MEIFLFYRIIETNKGKYLIIRGRNFDNKIDYLKAVVEGKEYKINVPKQEFYNIVPFAFLSCHIGYKLDKDSVNKGFITEAVENGIRIIFEEYGMHKNRGTCDA